MRVLIDTHVLLWWLSEPERLSTDVFRVFSTGCPVVSSASLWEVSIKVSLGKLSADVEDVCQAVLKGGFERLCIADADVVALTQLPPLHRDPFDRMLIVQSQREGIPLATADEKIRKYDIDTIML